MRSALRPRVDEVVFARAPAKSIFNRKEEIAAKIKKSSAAAAKRRKSIFRLYLRATLGAAAKARALAQHKWSEFWTKLITYKKGGGPPLFRDFYVPLLTTILGHLGPLLWAKIITGKTKMRAMTIGKGKTRSKIKNTMASKVTTHQQVTNERHPTPVVDNNKPPSMSLLATCVTRFSLSGLSFKGHQRVWWASFCVFVIASPLALAFWNNRGDRPSITEDDDHEARSEGGAGRSRKQAARRGNLRGSTQQEQTKEELNGPVPLEDVSLSQRSAENARSEAKAAAPMEDPLDDDEEERTDEEESVRSSHLQVGVKLSAQQGAVELEPQQARSGKDIVRDHFKQVTRADDACDADKFSQKYDELLRKWKKHKVEGWQYLHRRGMAIASDFDEMQTLIAKKACRVAGCKVCGASNSAVEWECISPGPEDYCAPVLPAKHEQLFEKKNFEVGNFIAVRPNGAAGGTIPEVGELSNRRTCFLYAASAPGPAGVDPTKMQESYSGGPGTAFEHVQFMCPDKKIERPHWEVTPSGSTKDTMSSLFALSVICVPEEPSKHQDYQRRIAPALEMPVFAEDSSGERSVGSAVPLELLAPGCKTARNRAELAYPNANQKRERLYAMCMLALDVSTANGQHPVQAGENANYGYGFFLSTLIDNGGLQLAFVNLFREFIGTDLNNGLKFAFVMNADAKLSMLRHPEAPDCKGKQSHGPHAFADCVMTPAFRTHVANSLRQFTDSLLLGGAELESLVNQAVYYVDLARHGLRVRVPFDPALGYIAPEWQTNTAMSFFGPNANQVLGQHRMKMMYYIGGGNVFDLMAEAHDSDLMQNYFASILQGWREKSILLAGQSAGSMVQNQDNSFLAFGLSGDPAPHHIYKESPYAFSKDGNFAGNCFDQDQKVDWPQLITPTQDDECEPVRDTDEKKGEWAKDRPLIPARSEGQDFSTWWKPSRNTAVNIGSYKVSDLQTVPLSGPERGPPTESPKCGTHGTKSNAEMALKACASYSYSCADLRGRLFVGGVSSFAYAACEQDTGLLDPEAKEFLGQPKTSSWTYMHYKSDTRDTPYGYNAEVQQKANSVRKKLREITPIGDRAIVVYRLNVETVPGNDPAAIRRHVASKLEVTLHLVSEHEKPEDDQFVGKPMKPAKQGEQTPSHKRIHGILVEGKEAVELHSDVVLSGRVVLVAFYCAHTRDSEKYKKGECANAERAKRAQDEHSSTAELRVRGSKLLRDPTQKNGNEDVSPDLVPFSRQSVAQVWRDIGGRDALPRVSQFDTGGGRVEEVRGVPNYQVYGGVEVYAPGDDGAGMYQGLRGLHFNIRPHLCSAESPKPIYESLMYGSFLHHNTAMDMTAITDGMAVVTAPPHADSAQSEPGRSRVILGDTELLLVGEKMKKQADVLAAGSMQPGTESLEHERERTPGKKVFADHSRSITAPDDACDAGKFAEVYDRLAAEYGRNRMGGGAGGVAAPAQGVEPDSEKTLKIAKKACRVAGCKVCGADGGGVKWQCVSPGPEDYCAPVLTTAQKNFFVRPLATPSAGGGTQSPPVHQATCEMFARDIQKEKSPEGVPGHTYRGGDGTVFEAMEFMCPEKPAPPLEPGGAARVASVFALSVVCIPRGDGSVLHVPELGRVRELLSGQPPGTIPSRVASTPPDPLEAGCLPAGERASRAYPGDDNVVPRAYAMCMLALDVSTANMGAGRSAFSPTITSPPPQYGYGFFLSTLIDNGGLQLAFANLFYEFESQPAQPEFSGPFTFIMNADAKLSMLRRPEACQRRNKRMSLVTIAECVMTPAFRTHVANSLRQFTDSIRLLPKYKNHFLTADNAVFYVDLVRHGLRIEVPLKRGSTFIAPDWTIANKAGQVRAIPSGTSIANPNSDQTLDERVMAKDLFPDVKAGRMMYYVGGGNVFDLMAEVRDAPEYFARILTLWRQNALLLAGQSAGSMVQNQDNSFLFFGLSGDPAPHHIFGPTYAFSKDGNFAGNCLVKGRLPRQPSVEYPQLITKTTGEHCEPSHDPDTHKGEWIKERPLVPARSLGQQYQEWWLPSQNTGKHITKFTVPDLQLGGSAPPEGDMGSDRCGAGGWGLTTGGDVDYDRETEIALACASYSYSCEDLRLRGVGGVSHGFFPACTLDIGLLDPRAKGYIGQPKTAPWVYVILSLPQGLEAQGEQAAYEVIGNAISASMHTDREVTVYRVTSAPAAPAAGLLGGMGEVWDRLVQEQFSEGQQLLQLHRVYPVQEQEKAAGPKTISSVAVPAEEARGIGFEGGRAAAGTVVLVAFFCPHLRTSEKFGECEGSERAANTAEDKTRQRGSKLLRNRNSKADDTEDQDKRPDLVAVSRQTIQEAKQVVVKKFGRAEAMKIYGGGVTAPPPTAANANLEKLVDTKEKLASQGTLVEAGFENADSVADHLGIYQGLKGVAPINIRPHACSASGVKPIFLSEMYETFALSNTDLSMTVITDGMAIVTRPPDGTMIQSAADKMNPGYRRVVLGDAEFALMQATIGQSQAVQPAGAGQPPLGAGAAGLGQQQQQAGLGQQQHHAGGGLLVAVGPGVAAPVANSHFVAGQLAPAAATPTNNMQTVPGAKADAGSNCC
ncbi:unnamed protein product [Amoebophrya sp. A120]|nr:unnamed protein product [Amoebophrya sp. A120]|eukprot:GSA120T00007574001.1